MSKIGGFGCILGGILWYPLFFYALSFFGIGASTDLRDVAGDTLFLIFLFAIVLLTSLLYIFCGFLGLLFWSFKYKNGRLNKKELFNLCFKGVYPQHWYREHNV